MAKTKKHMKRRKGYLSFRPGDRIEIEAVDHTSEDTEGWKPRDQVLKCTPLTLSVRGWYVGQDKQTYKIAFGKCNGNFSTIWMVPKKTLVRLRRG